MDIVLARVDERLIHGQILNEWVTRTEPTHLMIVDDALVEDLFMSNIYKALTPLWLDVQICSVAEAAARLLDPAAPPGRLILLTKTPRPFVELVKRGVAVTELTLADKAYFPNKIPVPAESRRAVNWLLAAGVRVIAQVSPEDPPTGVGPYKNISDR